MKSDKLKRLKLSEFSTAAHGKIVTATKIGIELAVYPPRNRYVIAWGDVDTPRKAFEKVLHLTTKTWATPDLLGDVAREIINRFDRRGWTGDV